MNAISETGDGSIRSGEMGRVILRAVLFGLGGMGSGWLSCQVLGLIDPPQKIWDFSGNRWVWPMWPGLVYGLFWLGAAWIPGALSVRPHFRATLRWSIAFVTGITFSYTAAYLTTRHAVEFLESRILWTNPLLICGFLGGIPGSLGLVTTWSILFRSADSWKVRSALVITGALLGTLLATWGTLCLFFATWQGGMAVAFSVADSACRVRGRNLPGYSQP